MHLYRRSLSCIVLCSVTAAVVTSYHRAEAGQPATPQALTKVRSQEVVHALFFLPQYVALANGYFRDEGLDVELSTAQGADRAMPALLAGNTDIILLPIYGIAISVFVTILMIYTGFQETDPNKIKLVRTFGATRWQVLRKVVLPGCVPTMIGALKVNVGLALVGVIVGEFQSAKAGLGYLILYGGQILQMNLVMTTVTILAIISTVMYLGIYYLEAAVMRRRQWAR